jgi:hypothetical protein
VDDVQFCVIGITATGDGEGAADECVRGEKFGVVRSS